MISDPQIFIRCDEIPANGTENDKCRRSIVCKLPSFGMNRDQVVAWLAVLYPEWAFGRTRHLCPECSAKPRP